MTGLPISTALTDHGPARRQPAPGGLEILRAFVNTLDIEEGTDALAAAEDARAWVRERMAIDVGPLSDVGHRSLLAFREALRELITTRDDGTEASAAARRTFDEVAAASPLAVTFDPGGRPRLRPVGTGVGAVIGRLLVEISAAAAAGTWDRLKICRNDACRWSYYDSSRNRSGVWCSMAICGNRVKGRAFRRRRASTGRA